MSTDKTVSTSSPAPADSSQKGKVLVFDPKRRKPGQRLAIGLAPGFVWNPLLTLEANRPCPCLSEKKFKACCRPKLPRAVPEAVAKEFREQMSKPDLVFKTLENEARLEEAAKAQAAACETTTEK